MKKLVYFVLLSFFFFSCNREKSKSEVYISGNIGHLIGALVTLKEIEPAGFRAIDSVRPGNTGKFSFHFLPGDAGFYVLMIGDNKRLILAIEKGESAVITGDRDSATGSFQIMGSPGTLLLQCFYNESAENQEIADSLEEILKRNMGTEDYYQMSTSFDTVFAAIIQAQRSLETAYIGEHPGSLTSLLVLNFAFGPEPVLSYQRDSSLFIRLDSALSKNYPGNKHVVYHHQRVMEYQRDAKLNKNL